MSNTQTTICVYAPEPITDAVLKRRYPLLKEHCPNLTMWLNPRQRTPQSAGIFLDLNEAPNAELISRRIGCLTAKTYRHKSSGELAIIPDMIAGLNPNLVAEDPNQRPKIHDLWLSVSPSQLHVPGIRQALDWVESCIASMLWLNDETLG